jgi:hypothetical protein
MTTKQPLSIVPDDKSGMWRIRLPDGTLSDMVNLTRAKEAASLALRGLPRAPGMVPDTLKRRAGTRITPRPRNHTGESRKGSRVSLPDRA